MEILYVSSLCTEKKYRELFDNSDVKPGLQIQKYHRLMCQGLKKNMNVELTALSSLPLNHKISRCKFIQSQKEKHEDINYIYLPFYNYIVLRQITLFISSFLYCIKWVLKNKSGVIICDALNLSSASAACITSKIFKRQTVGIITDVPGYLIHNNKKEPNFIKRRLDSIKTKINMIIISKFDSYVFLTKQMNDLINIKNKKYIVIEGQVDIQMKQIENKIEDKYSNRVCIYAGSLKKIYGIDMLVRGFISANRDNSELHIYGSGNYEDELTEICNLYPKIKYFGVVDNEYVVKEQMKATLLINPRPTNEDYTKYSFPSKNMEYMVSGTPILTTKLPGMPEGYNNYIYTIETEDVNGIAQKLKEVLYKDKKELHFFGAKSKMFVLKEKNNILQAKKIINMIKGESDVSL